MAGTLSEKLELAGGRPSGFDYLRLALAVSVVLIHVVVVEFGHPFVVEFWNVAWRRPIAGMVLPMFFALSGFLIAGSLFRTPTVPGFLALRALRILPALAVEITLSALILGVLFTTLPLREYFSDSLFSRYFLNILGEPQYFLPGVFASNPNPHFVNAQLWTIPWELKCYAAIAVMALFTLTNGPKRVLAAIAVFNVYLLATVTDVIPFFAVPAICLVQAFLAGLLLYTFRTRIPHRALIFVGCLALCCVLFSVPYGRLFVAFPAAYATVFIGLTNPTRSQILLSGDYSYGIFLYGYPIQQSFAHLTGGGHWIAHLLTVVPITFGVAAASWWLLEKHALTLRRFIPRAEARYVAFRKSAAKRLGVKPIWRSGEVGACTSRVTGKIG